MIGPRRTLTMALQRHPQSNANRTVCSQTRDAALPIADNLERILGVPLPAPGAPHAPGAEFAAECGICYAYRLLVDADGSSATPDRVCDNEQCARPFHEAPCLFDWLRAIPSNSVTFNTVFGDCPYCQTKISATKSAR